MPCNDDGTNLPGSYHAPIKAGGSITAHWDNTYYQTDLYQPFFAWLHWTGPMFVYLADCGGDCVSVTDTSKLKWFKIIEAGLTGQDDDMKAWEQGKLCGEDTDNPPPGWTITQPKNLKAGKYMIRHEIIYLNYHENDLQIYPACAHLDISGNGTQFPTEDYLVRFPGAYNSNGQSPLVFSHSI
jgi:hypothetical protein